MPSDDNERQRRDYGDRKVETNILNRLTVHLDQSHDLFVSQFSFLQRQHAHAIIIDAEERKALYQRPGML